MSMSMSRVVQGFSIQIFDTRPYQTLGYTVLIIVAKLVEEEFHFVGPAIQLLFPDKYCKPVIYTYISTG